MNRVTPEMVMAQVRRDGLETAQEIDCAAAALGRWKNADRASVRAAAEEAKRILAKSGRPKTPKKSLADYAGSSPSWSI